MTKASRKYELAWQHQVKQCRKFLRELERTPTIHGKKWKDAMLRHYRQKLKELLNQKDHPY